MTETKRIVNLTVADHDIDARLDKALAARLQDLSRSEIQTLIKADGVRVDGVIVRKPAYRLTPGEVIQISLAEAEPETIDPEPIPLEVIYADDDLAAINKPAGMVVHPAYGNRAGTLVNALLYHWPEVRGVGPEPRFGIVHRLDMDTSGVLVIARNEAALKTLQQQFKQRVTTKHYLALVEGTPDSDAGLIDAPIGRDPNRRKRMAVVRDGKPAQTRYDVLEHFIETTLIRLELLTGRTHQIRVHLQWLGYPIVGDTVYGFRKQRIKMKRLFLHASELEIDQPTTGERLTFRAPLPEHLEDVLTKLRRNKPDVWEDA
jgi:23S rRNA pseudouridine1911/1915/1917 synthase